MSDAVDFDLHGLVTLRLSGAAPNDVAAVERQLGLPKATHPRAPDVEVRYVDRLALQGPLRLLGAGEAGFTDEHFVVLRGKHKRPVRVAIPMHEVGGPCEVVAERSGEPIPLLVAILNLTVAHRGGVALHASAIEHHGRGILATGWSKGGKTEVLLGLSRRGGRYLADEWAYLRPDGQVGGLLEPMRIWDWHLTHDPELRSRLGTGSRAKLSATRAASVALDRTSRGAGRAARLASRLAPLMERQRHVDVDPATLLTRVGEPRGDLHHVFLVVSSEAAHVSVTPIEGEQVATRMLASLQHERAPLLACYQMHRFAFPGRSNPLIEGVEAVERDRLLDLLGHLPAHRVEHPYTVPIDATVDAMLEVLA